MSPELAAPAAVADAALAGPQPGGGNDALFARLYDELHRIARREAVRAGPDAVASPTTLLHEAYLDMAGRGSLVFPDRLHFLAYAGRAMRALVIDCVRARGALGRGGAVHITSLDTHVAGDLVEPQQLADIGAALDDLAALTPSSRTVVDLKFFCGFGWWPRSRRCRGSPSGPAQRRWRRRAVALHRALGGAP